MKIIGKIDARNLNRRLIAGRRRAERLDMALNSIKNLVQSSVEQNFQEEGRPTAWKALAAATIEARKRKRKAGKILQVSGQLASSINTRVERNAVIVGSNKPYAKIHDEGGTIRHPGGTKFLIIKGKFIPLKKSATKFMGITKAHDIKIDARTFLLFQKEDVKEAREILAEHLLRGIK